MGIMSHVVCTLVLSQWCKMLFHLLMLVLHCFTARSCITICFVVTHVYMGTAHVFFTVFTYLFVHIAHFAFIVLPPLFALLLSCIFTTNVHIAHFAFLVLKCDIFGGGSVLFHVAYPLLPWVVVCITIYMFLLCACWIFGIGSSDFGLDTCTTWPGLFFIFVYGYSLTTSLSFWNSFVSVCFYCCCISLLVVQLHFFDFTAYYCSCHCLHLYMFIELEYVALVCVHFCCHCVHFCCHMFIYGYSKPFHYWGCYTFHLVLIAYTFMHFLPVDCVSYRFDFALNCSWIESLT